MNRVVLCWLGMTSRSGSVWGGTSWVKVVRMDGPGFGAFHRLGCKYLLSTLSRENRRAT